MDLSIFDAFDKPAAASNSAGTKRVSLDRPAAQSAPSQDKKKKRSDEPGLSTDSKESTTQGITDAPLKMNDAISAGRSYIPAKEYKFKLDPFQQTAVDHIERGDSVLVAAHTSAGVKKH